jgi:hypothetical protein
VLLSVKAIFAVVSGVLLIQTNIFINQLVVYATKAKIGKVMNNYELITNNFL